MSNVLVTETAPFHSLENQSLTSYYSINGKYSEARHNFIQATRDAGVEYEVLKLKNILDRKGEELLVDLAYLGSPYPKKLFLVSSGTHGVELFHGSAIQVDLLKSKPQVPDGCGLLFVHALNPYGAEYSRRVNEANIDLNRNFILGDRPRANENDIDIQRLVNPTSGQELRDSLENINNIICDSDKTRLAQLITSVGVGQYSNPQGLIYGGDRLSESLELLKAYLQNRFQNLGQIVVLDIHSGLGEKGSLSVLFQSWNVVSPLNIPPEIRQYFRSAKDVVPYFDSVNGTLGDGLAELFPTAKILLLGAEFGTEPIPVVLRALITENFAHFQSNDLGFKDQTSSSLRDAFFPNDEKWRLDVLTTGSKLISELGSLCFTDL